MMVLPTVCATNNDHSCVCALCTVDRASEEGDQQLGEAESADEADADADDDDDVEVEDVLGEEIVDPAPYIVLALRDTAETRQIWPHSFELMYKVTALILNWADLSGVMILLSSDSLFLDAYCR